MTASRRATVRDVGNDIAENSAAHADKSYNRKDFTGSNPCLLCQNYIRPGQSTRFFLFEECHVPICF